MADEVYKGINGMGGGVTQPLSGAAASPSNSEQISPSAATSSFSGEQVNPSPPAPTSGAEVNLLPKKKKSWSKKRKILVAVLCIAVLAIVITGVTLAITRPWEDNSDDCEGVDNSTIEEDATDIFCMGDQPVDTIECIEDAYDNGEINSEEVVEIYNEITDYKIENDEQAYAANMFVEEVSFMANQISCYQAMDFLSNYNFDNFDDNNMMYIASYVIDTCDDCRDADAYNYWSTLLDELSLKDSEGYGF